MNTIPSTTLWSDELPVGVRFKAATGTSNVALQEVLVRQIIDALPPSLKKHPADTVSLEDAALAALTELQPRDSSDGLLGTGIVAAHFAAMDCLKRAMDAGQLPHVRDMNLRHAGRLLKTYLQLQEAFDRRRGQGPANVTVGNILNVEAGGKAVVGMQAEIRQVHAGAAGLAQGQDIREICPDGDQAVPVVTDERVKRSAVSVPQDERIKRPRAPALSNKRITRRG